MEVRKYVCGVFGIWISNAAPCGRANSVVTAEQIADAFFRAHPTLDVPEGRQAISDKLKRRESGSAPLPGIELDQENWLKLF